MKGDPKTRGFVSGRGKPPTVPPHGAVEIPIESVIAGVDAFHAYSQHSGYKLYPISDGQVRAILAAVPSTSVYGICDKGHDAHTSGSDCINWRPLDDEPGSHFDGSQDCAEVPE